MTLSEIRWIFEVFVLDTVTSMLNAQTEQRACWNYHDIYRGVRFRQQSRAQHTIFFSSQLPNVLISSYIFFYIQYKRYLYKCSVIIVLLLITWWYLSSNNIMWASLTVTRSFRSWARGQSINQLLQRRQLFPIDQFELLYEVDKMFEGGVKVSLFS